MPLEADHPAEKEPQNVHELTLEELDGFYRHTGIEGSEPVYKQGRYANLSLRPVPGAPDTYEIEACVNFDAGTLTPMPEMMELVAYRVVGNDGQEVTRGVLDEENYGARFSVPANRRPFTLRFFVREDLTTGEGK